MAARIRHFGTRAGGFSPTLLHRIDACKQDKLDLKHFLIEIEIGWRSRITFVFAADLLI